MNNKYIIPIVRVSLLLMLTFIIIEIVMGDSSGNMVFIEKPIASALILIMLLALVAIEMALIISKEELIKRMTEEERHEYLNRPSVYERSGLASWFEKKTKLKPIEQEEDITLDHDYDGIKELDNLLPPWWINGFYLSIVFAFIYLFYYQVLGNNTQIEEYENEILEANIAIEEYKKTAKDLINYSSATLLVSETDLKKGKSIYSKNCVACHKSDGGGSIGPNLTDDYWILGGGINNVFKTISKGGRPSKGMEAWSKKGLKPSQIQQVASYILVELKGTNPKDAKPIEGELWEEKPTTEE